MTEFTPPETLDEKGECFFICLSPPMGKAHTLARTMADIMLRLDERGVDDHRARIDKDTPIHYRYAPKAALLQIMAEAIMEDNYMYGGADDDGELLAVFIGPVVGEWPKGWWTKTSPTADITLIDNAINCTIEGEHRVDTRQYAYRTDIGLNGKPISVNTAIDRDEVETAPSYDMPRRVTDKIVDDIAKRLAAEIFGPIFEASQRMHGRKF